MVDTQWLKEQITDDDIIAIMDDMGIPLVSANSQYLLFFSVCHHPNDWESHKPKLYWYIQSSHAHCYSCGGDWDIFGLVQHIKHCTFKQALEYICNLLNINTTESSNKQDVDNWQKDLRRWLPNADKDESVNLLTYDKSILQVFDHLYPKEWLDYGITRDSMDKFGIGWYARQACISIPVVQNGQLLGCRGRYTRPQDIERGKYRPISLLDGTVMKFPSSSCLYGYDQNKASVKQVKTVWLVESEKSVLKMDSWGIHNVLAVFGSNVSKQQIHMLLDLDVSKIILSFDSDYAKIGDDDYKFFIAKMKKIIGKLKPYFQVEVVYNNMGFDGKKYAPCDFTFEQFNNLFNHRIIL